MMRKFIGPLALSFGAVALVHAVTSGPAPLDASLASSCSPSGPLSRTCGVDTRRHPDRRQPVPAAPRHDVSPTAWDSPTDPRTPGPTPQPGPPPPAKPQAPAPTPSSGWPDASNTGVPAGTTLTLVPGQLTTGPGWTWNAGYQCVEVTGEGATLDGLAISGCVDVSAPGVTIQRTAIAVPATSYWGVGVRHVAGTVVRDCDIYSPHRVQGQLVAVKDVYGDTSVTVVRSDLSDWGTGVQVNHGLVRDSYIHDPHYVEGDHTHGTTSSGGLSTGRMVLRHNTILNPSSQADAISLSQDLGLIGNVVVDDNLIAGGGYALSGGGGAYGIATRITVTRNRFSTRYYPRSGFWGPVAHWDRDASNTWSGNVWADGPRAGQVISQP